MAIPVLQLNLVPSPTFWRHRHVAIGWVSLVLGGFALIGITGFTVKTYLDARREGRQAVALTEQAKRAATQEARLVDELRSIDAAAEQGRWRLAERILLERSLPWSRITAELERSSVQDVRFKSIQRVRPQGGQGVQVKLRLEVKNREAEVAFVESVQQNPFFQGVVFEREVERQGGGLELEASLPVSTTPPAFVSLPEYGPDRKRDAQAQPTPGPQGRPVPALKAASQVTPVRPQAAPRIQAVPQAEPEAPDEGPRRPGLRVPRPALLNQGTNPERARPMRAIPPRREDQ